MGQGKLGDATYIFCATSAPLRFFSYWASIACCSCLTSFAFSIANSSSALTLISRAFSSASCLMNATWGDNQSWTQRRRYVRSLGMGRK